MVKHKKQYSPLSITMEEVEEGIVVSGTGSLQSLREVLSEAEKRHIAEAIERTEFSPVTILDARWNVIAWNMAAVKIVLDYGKINASKRNMIRIMFTNEVFKKSCSDWELAAQGMLARFRTTYGKFIEDPWIKDFANELKSESFIIWIFGGMALFVAEILLELVFRL